MRNLILFISFLLYLQITYSQEYSFPLYFEDAIGKRDTLYFGFDESATSGIDEELGEVNLINQPYDSTFIAFFTDGATYDEFDDLNGIKTPNYVIKKQYNNIFEGFYFEIGIINQNWPLTVSWNNKQIINSDLIEYSGNPNFKLLMTNFHSPGGWFDALECGFPCACAHLGLADTNKVTIGVNQLCSYQVNFCDDIVNLLYIGYIDKDLPINHIGVEKVRCWYNIVNESICFDNFKNSGSFQIQLYSISGDLLQSTRFLNNNIPQLTISEFDNGLYFVRLIDITNQTYYSSFKIIKL